MLGRQADKGAVSFVVILPRSLSRSLFLLPVFADWRGGSVPARLSLGFPTCSLGAGSSWQVTGAPHTLGDPGGVSA